MGQIPNSAAETMATARAEGALVVMGGLRDRCGAGGDVAVGRDAQAGGGGSPGDEPVGLGEFGLGGGEADLQAFGFPGPAFAVSLGDPRGQVVADGGQPGPLAGVDAQERAADVLVDAAGSPGAAAVAEGELAAFEVSLHLFKR